MSVKEFIEAAIEGGWSDNNCFTDNPHHSEFIKEEMFLDPEAWKAVGKVKGWKVGAYPYADEMVNNYRTGFVAQYEGVDFYGEYWQYAMHLMIDALIKGRTLEEYIATL